MPTPVGPVPPDPNDPDLWTEWYDDDERHDDGGDDFGGGFGFGGSDVGPSRFGWPVRLIAILAILGVILVLVL